MRFRSRLPLLAVVLLSGCARLISVYNDEFECPRATGDGPCESLSTAYRRATTPQPLPPPPDPHRHTGSGAPGATDTWVPPVKTVWLAPWVDNAGRRHEAAVLRIVVMPGTAGIKPEPEFLVPPVPEPTEDGGLLTPPAPPAELPGATTKPAGRGIPGNHERSQRPSVTAPSRSPFGTSPTHQPPGAGFSLPGF
jgi:hypothetical protein